MCFCVHMDAGGLWRVDTRRVSCRAAVTWLCSVHAGLAGQGHPLYPCLPALFPPVGSSPRGLIHPRTPGLTCVGAPRVTPAECSYPAVPHGPTPAPLPHLDRRLAPPCCSHTDPALGAALPSTLRTTRSLERGRGPIFFSPHQTTERGPETDAWSALGQVSGSLIRPPHPGATSPGGHLPWPPHSLLIFPSLLCVPRASQAQRPHSRQDVQVRRGPGEWQQVRRGRGEWRQPWPCWRAGHVVAT